mmetsp:Transcript_18496/g.20986  ORF Transcript_18496/g.20986 Transcript_18496/m.20986 type:complete len:89 (+) Transcript_18496:272-538(+)
MRRLHFDPQIRVTMVEVEPRSWNEIRELFQMGSKKEIESIRKVKNFYAVAEILSKLQIFSSYSYVWKTSQWAQVKERLGGVNISDLIK